MEVKNDDYVDLGTNREHNNKVSEEIEQSSLSYVIVKQEYYKDNVEESQQDPLAINDSHIKTIKKEIKDEVTTEVQEQNFEDASYNIDVIDHKFDNSASNNHCSGVRIYDSPQHSSSNSYAKDTDIVLDEEEANPSLCEHKRSVRKRKQVSQYGYEEFNTKLNAHESIECLYCNKAFSHKSDVMKHVRAVHLNIKFECKECPKLFTHSGGLKRHINVVHFGSKEFKCNECQKMFPYKTNLKTHITGVHKRLKNYECHVCYKRFSQIGGVTSHIKQVHKRIKDCECYVCHKMFYDAQKLKRHVNEVHKRNKFQCSECGEMFYRIGNLKTHVSIKHKVP